MGKLKSYSGSLFEERGLVINLKLYTGGGGLIRERGRGGWSETIRVVDLEEREPYFLLFH